MDEGDRKKGGQITLKYEGESRIGDGGVVSSVGSEWIDADYDHFLPP